MNKWTPIDFENNYLPKKYMEHGTYYFGQCRNASIAKWNADEQVFYYWRYKFGWHIETIKHPDDETNTRMDVFFPHTDINEPKEIPFDKVE